MNKNVFFEQDLYTEPSINIYNAKNFPPHYHKHVEFIYITEGSMTVSVDGISKELTLGEGVFIFPYRVHDYRLTQGECERFIAVFEPEYFGGLSRIFEKRLPQAPFIEAHVFEKHRELLDSVLASKRTLPGRPYPSAEYAAFLARFSLLMSLILEELGIEWISEKGDSTYLKAIKVCCDNFTDEALTIDDIAAAVHISRSRLQHIFSEESGMGLKEYLVSLRLTHAERLLADSSLSVTDIALQSGFSTVRTFNRAFTKKHGMSPGAYRKGQLIK